MAFGNEITARLGLKTADYEAGLKKAQKEGESFADTTGRVIERKFGTFHLIKGLMQGLGIGTVEKVGDLIVKPWKDAADRAEAIAKSMEEAVKSEQALYDMTASPEDRLARLKGELARHENAMNGLGQQKQVEDEIAAGNMFGTEWMLGDAREAEKIAVRLAAEHAAAAANRIDIAKLEAEIGKKNTDEAKKQEELKNLQLEASGKELDDAAKITALEKQRDDLLGKGGAAAPAGGAAKADIDSQMEAARIQIQINDLVKKQGDQKAEQAAKEAAAADALAAKQQAAAEEAQKKQDEANAEQDRWTAEHTEQMKHGQEEVAKAKEDLDRDDAGRLEFTVGEAAAGQRGNSFDQTRARQIEQLEAQARRAFDAGNLDTAHNLMGRADQLRISLEGRASDAQVLRAQLERLNEANLKLQEISSRLAPVHVGT